MGINYRDELYVNVSWHDSQKTIFRILAGPGQRQYKGIDLSKDRIIYLQIEKDGITLEYPYSVIDQLAIWELVFDVWQKPEKKLSYAKKFLNLIYSKLLQSKLNNFAKAYWNELIR